MTAPPSDWRPYLGRKVSLRYRLRGDPDYPFSETIGVLAAVDEAEGEPRLTVLKRRGEQVVVAARDIEAAKIFPA